MYEIKFTISESVKTTSEIENIYFIFIFNTLIIKKMKWENYPLQVEVKKLKKIFLLEFQYLIIQ